MKIKNTHTLLTLLAAVIAFIGCDLDSGDDVVREVGGTNISGLYTNSGSAIISPSNSGTTITSLNIIQTGDRLEAVTNDGLVFRGTIGNLVNNVASYSITGTTGAGRSATLAGSIRVDSGTASLTGTWIEAGLFGTATATASVAVPTPTATPAPTATATPTP